MSSINFPSVNFESQFAGLKQNQDGINFLVAYPGGTLAAGETTRVIATGTLNNVNSVTHTMLNYAGLETNWRICDGVCGGYFGAAPDFFCESFSYFSSTTLSVVTYIGNNTGGSVAVPAFTVNCTASVYEAPF